jgi:hypothetical protein
MINVPHVVHETIDGETILIHLGTGAYYSLDGVGATIWGLLAAGASGGELTAAIESRYDAEPAQVERTVQLLVEELLREELLAPAPQGFEAPPAPVEVAETSGAPFVAPVLHKYTDMQEFMLVDPIHDVDAEAGWPHAKPA